MTYATLVFGRVKVRVVTVTEDDETRELERDQAEQYHERTNTERETYHRQLQEQLAGKAAFMRTVQVRSYSQARAEYDAAPRRFGFTQGTMPDPFDEITIAGTVHKVAPGKAEEFVAKEVARRFPEPVEPSIPDAFDKWFTQNSREKRTWHAELVTGEGSRRIGIDDARQKWGFVIGAAMRELDRFERDGWTLVHVSEDHGLYAGADSPDEAYLTRVRYLLRKDA